jgi:hypothetical protein
MALLTFTSQRQVIETPYGHRDRHIAWLVNTVTGHISMHYHIYSRDNRRIDCNPIYWQENNREKEETQLHLLPINP